MSWNYRILAHEEPDRIILQVHEVHYEKGEPVRYAPNPAIVMGANVGEIWQAVIALRECHRKPVLWAGDKFPQIYRP